MPNLFYHLRSYGFLSILISFIAVASLFFLPTPDSSDDNLLKLADMGGKPTIDSSGITISYVLYKNGNSEIWLMRNDGREKRLLVSIEGNISKLCWNPEGLDLAFIVNQEAYRIFKISRFGGDLTPLTRTLNNIEQFEWFGDGWVLHDGFENGKWSLWLSKTDKVYFRVSPFGIETKHPSIARGTSLVAVSVKYMEGYKIALYNIATGSWTKLTFGNGDDLKPRFSPDGKSVAYLSNRTGRWSIWVKNIDTSAEVDLTAQFSEKRYPRWAPEVDLNTTLLWTPDSKHLLFDGRRGDSREIYMMNLTGGSVTLRGVVKEYFPLILNVVFEGGAPYNMVLDPTGSRVYFENKKESGIWRLDLSVRRTSAYG